MADSIELKTEDDERLIFNEGECGTVEGTFKDKSGATFVKASILTLTATLTTTSGTIINSRSGQDVLDANGGTLDDDGNFVLFLSTLDNIIVSSTAEKEEHYLLLKWTWSDGTNSWTSSTNYSLWVNNLPTPTSP